MFSRVLQGRLKGCYSEVSMMFHTSFSDRKFPQCFKKVCGFFQGRSRVFEGNSTVFQRRLRMVQGSFKAVQMKFPWCLKESFKGVAKKFAWCFNEDCRVF